MEQNTTNKPLRRVGTLTLGVCLIAAGTLFLLARFLPGLPWLVIWQVLPAAGLILLGCEVLYYSARPGACRCDFGFCFYEEDSGLSNEEKWENRPEENAKMIGYNFLIGKFRRTNVRLAL